MSVRDLRSSGKLRSIFFIVVSVQTFVSFFKGLGSFWIIYPWKVRPTCCPEILVRNYHYTLRNNPEERRSHLLRCGNLKEGSGHFVFL